MVTGSGAAAMVLMAGALWWWPSTRWRIHRVVDLPPRQSGQPRWLGVSRTADDPFTVAATLDLFAVCLRAGLPIAAAVRVAGTSAPPSLARHLEATAELLELGAEPQHAWSPRRDTGRRRGGSKKKPDSAAVYFDELAQLARRSSRAGSAFSGGVAELAERVRREAQDGAVAGAERAGVLVSGPLGLCFLPAFICLGIVPVVIGLAAGTLGNL